jgi:guanylate kinase
MINERKLVVVSGPSGCGKDTVVKHLMALRDDVLLSISCTTRRPRKNEVDGTHYYFLTEQEFRGRVERGRMLEYTRYDGQYYGTPLDEIEQKLVGGNTVVLIIEVEGAKNVKTAYPDSLCVFIVPPSLEALEERLRARETEDEDEINRRLKIAAAELEELTFYDCAVENCVAAECAERLSDIIDRWQAGEGLGPALG